MRISDWSSDVCSSDLRDASGKHIPPDAGGATPDRARKLAQPGNGAHQRSHELYQHSGGKLASRPHRQSQGRCALPPERPCRMDRTGSTGQKPPPRKKPQERNANRTSEELGKRGAKTEEYREG